VRGERNEGSLIEGAEIGTPVDEARHARAAGVEQNADTRGTEVMELDGAYS
jgi:hypothetical protein